jgi:glycosyltransferase involved in cell wall biosynthesis
VRILSFAHHLEIGGSQVNAIDIASGLTERGHVVDVFATAGPAQRLVAERGLRHIAAPSPRTNPSPAVIRSLATHLRAERYDLVHAWDWPQCVNAFYGTRLAGSVPLVGSIMSMVVTRVVPTSMPLTYGTEELLDAARERGYHTVDLLEPPVNTELDDPSAVDGQALRAELGIGRDEIVVTVVSRLVGWLKLEGIRAAMHAITGLAADYPLRFVVVGGGTAEPELRALAAELNAQCGREVVLMTGALVDPRPGYAAADIVIGMGGSILRGMTYAKPAIVLGENGFARIFDAASAADFCYRGMYGLGDGSDLTPRLRELVRQLAAGPQRRSQLGSWSRELILQRYALKPVVERFEEFVTRRVLAGNVQRRKTDGLEILLRRGVASSSDIKSRLGSRIRTPRSESTS